MNKFYSTLLPLGFAVFTSSVSAADTGWYAGLDLGSSDYAVMKPDLTEISQVLAERGVANTTTESDTATAYGVDVGYQFDRYFALEGGYTDFGSSSSDINITFPAPFDSPVKVHAKGETLFAVGILPVSDRFSLFGKLGLLTYTQDLTSAATITGVGPEILPKYSDSGTTSGIGVGASWAINDRFGLRLGFTRFHAVGDANNTGQGTIDLGYLQFVVHF
ncbi:MAG TPA: outer membrane beta-barrel protein [Gammaproteobacteria bacterium]|jgi:OOP family OmpA-OmpF porin|nr:outer membrane beta-barrel protein [Gammaproteobacteria bacterium]